MNQMRPPLPRGPVLIRGGRLARPDGSDQAGDILIGADGRIVRIWRKVRVKGHADAVLEAAKAL